MGSIAHIGANGDNRVIEQRTIAVGDGIEQAAQFGHDSQVHRVVTRHHFMGQIVRYWRVVCVVGKVPMNVR